MILSAPSPRDFGRRVDAALGRIPCDLLIRGARRLDVFTCEWVESDVAVIDGVIVAVDPGLKAKREINANGKFLVPGFIDAHVHVESSMMLPQDFQRAVLSCGTTSAICDPHEIANVIGLKGIEFFLSCAEKMDMDLWVMLSSCVPATHLETNGGGTLFAKDLLSLKNHPRALGLAEMMNMPGVLHKDEDILNKITGFSDHRLDGHAPLLRGLELSAYAACGISSCHESSEKGEAHEKLMKGISVWVREGSVAKDLAELASLLTMKTSTSMGFCTDDRNPLDIAEEGHVDYLVRSAVGKYAVPMEVAYRAASWSVSRHYGLDQGPHRTGAIAPGYAADFLLLDDAKTVAIREVFKRGRLVSEIAPPSFQVEILNTIRANDPLPEDLEPPTGRVHVIKVIEGKIITGREVRSHNDRGVQRLSVLERYGHGSKPANAYVQGFGDSFQGAIASTVGHDSHNLISVGSNANDMSVAMKSLIECGGGFSVVQNGKVLSRLELPFGGLMSRKSPKELHQNLVSLKQASRQIGCTLHEPFLQLAFLSLPVIPTLKLTDRGLVDVEKFNFISVTA